MSHHGTKTARSGRRPALLVLLVPVLLLGAALAGDGLLVHEHGEDGHHYHVVSGSGPGEHAHHGSHGAGLARASPARSLGERGGDPRESPRWTAPGQPGKGAGVRLAFPRLLLPSGGGAATLAFLLAAASVFLAPLPGCRDPVPVPAGTGPPGRPCARAKQRSGIASVAAVSRAIRI